MSLLFEANRDYEFSTEPTVYFILFALIKLETCISIRELEGHFEEFTSSAALNGGKHVFVIL